MEQTKKCGLCKKVRNTAEFDIYSSSPDGLMFGCVFCRAKWGPKGKSNLEKVMLDRAHKKCVTCGSIDPLYTFEVVQKGFISYLDECISCHLTTVKKLKSEKYVVDEIVNKVENCDTERYAHVYVELRELEAQAHALRRALYDTEERLKDIRAHLNLHTKTNNGRYKLLRKQKISIRYADAIRDVYLLATDIAELSGYKVHVDHICPIKAQVFDPDFGVSLPASGLHVPWNLDPIPKAVNLRKHNNVTLAEILA